MINVMIKSHSIWHREANGGMADDRRSIGSVRSKRLTRPMRTALYPPLCTRSVLGGLHVPHSTAQPGGFAATTGAPEAPLVRAQAVAAAFHLAAGVPPRGERLP